MNAIFARLHARLLVAQDGQTMAEYGVVLAVICTLTVGAFALLSTAVRGAITDVIGTLTPG